MQVPKSLLFFLGLRAHSVELLLLVTRLLSNELNLALSNKLQTSLCQHVSAPHASISLRAKVTGSLRNRYLVIITVPRILHGSC